MYFRYVINFPSLWLWNTLINMSPLAETKKSSTRKFFHPHPQKWRKTGKKRSRRARALTGKTCVLGSDLMVKKKHFHDIYSLYSTEFKCLSYYIHAYIIRLWICVAVRLITEYIFTTEVKQGNFKVYLMCINSSSSHYFFCHKGKLLKPKSLEKRVLPHRATLKWLIAVMKCYLHFLSFKWSNVHKSARIYTKLKMNIRNSKFQSFSILFSLKLMLL